MSWRLWIIITRMEKNMQLNELVEVNKNFQFSINLEFDYNKKSKILEYIPTTDICEVLSSYCDAIMHGNNCRATTLIGPYGKGKSYLIFVLLYIVNNYDDNNSIEILLKKISLINPLLAEKIINIREKHIKLLPVLLDASFLDLNQSFSLALKESLEREKLNELIPISYYEECVNLIKKWKKNKDLKAHLLECCERKKVDLDSLSISLSKHIYDSYKVFCDFYECLTYGQPFVALNNQSVVDSFISVLNQLKKYGYNGFFIVFDEFGKYLDNEGRESASNLKILQDFAEYANRDNSLDKQLHICCITHKPLSFYSKGKSEVVVNTFRTIEGRFKELRFNRSLKENYEIVDSAIIKKPRFASFINNFYRKNSAFYEKIANLNIFNLQNLNNEQLFKNCYPLNPLTVYFLVQMSEKVAQNERTIFTYISDNDLHSLNSYINNYTTDDNLLDVSSVYDYLSILFSKDESKIIRDYYFQAESCINRASTILMKKILKVMSLIFMVGNTMRIRADVNTIALSLKENEEKIEQDLENMVSIGILKKNYASETYSFVAVGTNEINKLVEAYIFKNNILPTSNVYECLGFNRFVVPKKYNLKAKMTRFYKVIYLNDTELMSLVSFKNFFENNFCDGLVINVVLGHILREEIKDHFKEMKFNQKVILRIPNKAILPVYLQRIVYLFSISQLKNNKENDESLTSELASLIRLEKDDLTILFNSIFQDSELFCLYTDNKIRKIDYYSYIFENVYFSSPYINNELINKNEVSAQYQKAINYDVDKLLSGEIIDKSETSPEMTSYNACFLQKDFANNRAIIELFKSIFTKKEGEKVCFNDFYKIIKKEPYGMRNGIITFFVTIALTELSSNNIILYYDNKEVPLNSKNLTALINYPEHYFFLVEKGFKNQFLYIKKLCEVFNVEFKKSSNRENIIMLVDGMKNYFLGLPRIIRESNIKNNFLLLDGKFIDIKNELIKYNINSYELLFKRIPDIFDNSDLVSISGLIENELNRTKICLENYKSKICNSVREMFSSNTNGSIKSSVIHWQKTNGLDLNLISYKDDVNSKIARIFAKGNFDDDSIIQELSAAINNEYIEDWDFGKEEEFLNRIVLFRDSSIKNKTNINKNQKINELICGYNYGEFTPIGKTLKSNIDSIISDYGGSVSGDEKIAILIEIMKKIL